MELPNTSPDKIEDIRPFKNKITYYPNGRVRSEQYYTDDELLLKEIIYSESGQIKEIINYKKDGAEDRKQTFENDAKKSGISISYYEHGVMQSQRYYVAGQIHWEEKIFDEKGRLIEIVTYRRGHKEGPNIIYHSKGYKLNEVNYKDNLPHGQAKFFYDNGQLKAEVFFDKGIRQGISKIYYNNGVMEIEEMLKDDVRDGCLKTFYENGGIKEEWGFKNGLPEGTSRFFYSNGKLYGEKSYKEGKEDGLHRFFYQDGRIKEEMFYSDGVLQGQPKYFPESEYVTDPEIQSKEILPQQESFNTPELVNNKSRNIILGLSIVIFVLLLYIFYTFIIYRL